MIRGGKGSYTLIKTKCENRYLLTLKISEDELERVVLSWIGYRFLGYTLNEVTIHIVKTITWVCGLFIGDPYWRLGIRSTFGL